MSNGDAGKRRQRHVGPYSEPAAGFVVERHHVSIRTAARIHRRSAEGEVAVALSIIEAAAHEARSYQTRLSQPP